MLVVPHPLGQGLHFLPQVPVCPLVGDTTRVAIAVGESREGGHYALPFSLAGWTGHRKGSLSDRPQGLEDTVAVLAIVFIERHRGLSF